MMSDFPLIVAFVILAAYTYRRPPGAGDDRRRRGHHHPHGAVLDRLSWFQCASAVVAVRRHTADG
jgi:hypothetical protein